MPLNLSDLYYSPGIRDIAFFTVMYIWGDNSWRSSSDLVNASLTESFVDYSLLIIGLIPSVNGPLILVSGLEQ